MKDPIYIQSIANLEFYTLASHPRQIHSPTVYTPLSTASSGKDSSLVPGINCSLHNKYGSICIRTHTGFAYSRYHSEVRICQGKQRNHKKEEKMVRGSRTKHRTNLSKSKTYFGWVFNNQLCNRGLRCRLDHHSDGQPTVLRI